MGLNILQRTVKNIDVCIGLGYRWRQPLFTSTNLALAVTQIAISFINCIIICSTSFFYQSCQIVPRACYLTVLFRLKYCSLRFLFISPPALLSHRP